MLSARSLLIAFHSTCIHSLSPQQNNKKVLATQLQTITLHNGRLTTGRRASPIPQLKCTGGSAKDLFEVDTMRCHAQGSSYDTIDIQWTCTAETGPYFKLGSTQVLCEGYDHADDPYILKGSCGVEYRLILTEEGEAKFQHSRPQYSEKQKTDLPALLFWILFMVVGFVIVRGIVRQWQQNRQEPRRALQGVVQGPNDDDGDGDDPPPPYDEDDYGDGALAKKFPKGSTKSPSITQEAMSAANQAGPSSDRMNSRFGSAANVAMAAAAGAAAGVAATQAYRSSTRTQHAAEDREQSSSRSRTTRMWDSENSYGGSSQSQESIGFGGTTRR